MLDIFKPVYRIDANKFVNYLYDETHVNRDIIDDFVYGNYNNNSFYIISLESIEDELEDMDDEYADDYGLNEEEMEGYIKIREAIYEAIISEKIPKEFYVHVWW